MLEMPDQKYISSHNNTDIEASELLNHTENGQKQTGQVLKIAAHTHSCYPLLSEPVALTTLTKTEELTEK